MKIRWLFTDGSTPRQELSRVNLEYALQLQVRLILIREAEELLDKISLAILDVNPSTGSINIGKDTPEPLYSVLLQHIQHITFPTIKVGKTEA